MNEFTNNNTVDYIDDFIKDNNGNQYFVLEHLLSLEVRKSAKNFVDEIAKMQKDNDYVLNRIKERIAYHFIMYFRNIDMFQLQTLNDKIFDNKLSYTKYSSLNKNVII